LHHTKPKDWFQEAITKLPQPWRWSRELQGDYFNHSWNFHISAMCCISIRLVSIIFEWHKYTESVTAH
jgi:hypothetical protein